MHHQRTTTALATLATAIGATLAGGLLSPTQAASGYEGRVDATGGLVAHYVPSSGTPAYGSYADGATLRLVCKVRSVSVGDNDRWYLVKGSARRWVSARYVENVGAAPRACGDGRRSTGTVTAARLNRREGPTTRADKAGVLERGDRVSVVCWVDGLGESGGDAQWYQLGNGTWVSSAYIGPTKRRVELCA